MAAQIKQIEAVKTANLIPYARNAKLHSESQVAQIAASIREFGFNNPVLIDKDNGIIAGHGRVLAAQKLSLLEVPCLRLSHLTETQKRAYIIADNRLSETGGGWDTELLALEIEDLRLEDFDIDLTGFDAGTLEAMFEDDLDKNDDETSGNTEPKQKLSDRFLLPPFSVLNARDGWWQDRKRAWLALGIKSELGRGDAAPGGGGGIWGHAGPSEFYKKASPGGALMPAMDYSKRQRGTGNGKPII